MPLFKGSPEKYQPVPNEEELSESESTNPPEVMMRRRSRSFSIRRLSNITNLAACGFVIAIIILAIYFMAANSVTQPKPGGHQTEGQGQVVVDQGQGEDHKVEGDGLGLNVEVEGNRVEEDEDDDNEDDDEDEDYDEEEDGRFSSTADYDDEDDDEDDEDDEEDNYMPQANQIPVLQPPIQADQMAPENVNPIQETPNAQVDGNQGNQAVPIGQTVNGTTGQNETTKYGQFIPGGRYEPANQGGMPTNQSSSEVHKVKIKQALDNINKHFETLHSNVSTVADTLEKTVDTRVQVLQDLAWLHQYLTNMTSELLREKGQLQKGEELLKPSLQEGGELLKPSVQEEELLKQSIQRGPVQSLKEENELIENVLQGGELKPSLDSALKEAAQNEVKEEAPRPANPPHIVVVMASELGWADVGYHNSDIKTPNIDALAAEGVRMDNHYVQDSSTGTRSQLLTGKYQIHTMLQHTSITPDVPTGLPVSIPTLPQRLKETSNYSTNLIGKWHLGFCEKEYLPTRRGFDYFFGFLGGSEGYYSHDYCGPAFHGVCAHDLWQNEEPFNDSTTYSTHMYTRRAQDVIEAHVVRGETKPLFLMVSYQAVSSPQEVPAHYEALHPHIAVPLRRTHAGMVACLDEGVGNISRTLKETGMWGNTLFLFLTDNGGSLFQGSINSPYRGGQGELWEGGLKGVAVVAGPHVRRPGFVSQEFVHVSDWFPTLLWLAHVDVDESNVGKNVNGIDGINIWQAASGIGKSPRVELLHNIDPIFRPRGNPVAAEYQGIFDTTIRAAYRYKEWKIITGCPYSKLSLPDNLFQNVWLYNIESDPQEMINLAYNNPQTVRALLMRLSFFLKDSAPVWYPDPDPRAHPAQNEGLLRPWLSYILKGKEKEREEVLRGETQGERGKAYTASTSTTVTETTVNDRMGRSFN